MSSWCTVVVQLLSNESLNNKCRTTVLLLHRNRAYSLGTPLLSPCYTMGTPKVISVISDLSFEFKETALVCYTVYSIQFLLTRFLWALSYPEKRWITNNVFQGKTDSEKIKLKTETETTNIGAGDPKWTLKRKLYTVYCIPNYGQNKTEIWDNWDNCKEISWHYTNPQKEANMLFSIRFFTATLGDKKILVRE